MSHRWRSILTTAIVLTGSWGRREVTRESDDDFMVLIADCVRGDVPPAVAETAEALGAKPPGREEIFGTHVRLGDLRDKIGRDEDSIANLTRRMLLILESVAVCNEPVHSRARRALLAGYLDANVKDHRPPRFLLNDLVATGERSQSTSRARCARKGEGWGFAMRSFGFLGRSCSPADWFRCSSATGTPSPRCSTSSMSACRNPARPIG